MNEKYDEGRATESAKRTADKIRRATQLPVSGILVSVYSEFQVESNLEPFERLEFERLADDRRGIKTEIDAWQAEVFGRADWV